MPQCLKRMSATDTSVLRSMILAAVRLSSITCGEHVRMSGVCLPVHHGTSGHTGSYPCQYVKGRQLRYGYLILDCELLDSCV